MPFSGDSGKKALKAKRIRIPFAARKEKASGAREQMQLVMLDEYERALKGRVGSVSLAVHMDERRMSSVIPFKIERIRESIPYREGASVRYRTATHRIMAQDASAQSLSGAYMACDEDGHVELYSARGEDGMSSPIGSAKVSRRIVDPVMAVAYDGRIYLALNAPTEELASRGARARTPRDGDGEGSPLHIASGCLNITVCDPDDRSLRVILRSEGAYDPYYLFASSDASGAPVFMTVNLDAGGAGEDGWEDEGPGFVSLLDSVFGDEEEEPVKPDRAIPVGLSAFSVPDGRRFKQIPMSGCADYGVASVCLSGTCDEMDRIRLVVGDGDGQEHANGERVCESASAAENRAPEEREHADRKTMETETEETETETS